MSFTLQQQPHLNIAILGVRRLFSKFYSYKIKYFLEAYHTGNRYRPVLTNHHQVPTVTTRKTDQVLTSILFSIFICQMFLVCHPEMSTTVR